MKRFAVACALALGFWTAQDARGAILIQANLTGTPGSGSPGFGIGTVLLNDTQDSITVTLSVFSLQGFATSAGIFGPANPGEAGPLMFPLAGIAVPPSQQSFTIGGVFFITPEQRDNLLNRLFYFNVYSTLFPEGGPISNFANAFSASGPSAPGEGGELRGQLDTFVPEPATYVSLAAGLGLCLAARRRRSAARA